MGRRSGFTRFRTEIFSSEKRGFDSEGHFPEVSPPWDAPLQEVHYLNQFAGIPGRQGRWEAGSRVFGGRFHPYIRRFSLKGFVLLALGGLFRGPIVGEYALYQ